MYTKNALQRHSIRDRSNFFHRLSFTSGCPRLRVFPSQRTLALPPLEELRESDISTPIYIYPTLREVLVAIIKGAILQMPATPRLCFPDLNLLQKYRGLLVFYEVRCVRQSFPASLRKEFSLFFRPRDGFGCTCCRTVRITLHCLLRCAFIFRRAAGDA